MDVRARDLISDLITASGATEVSVRVIACTCPPNEKFCDCTRERRSTIVRSVDAIAMAAIEQARIENPGRPHRYTGS